MRSIQGWATGARPAPGITAAALSLLLVAGCHSAAVIPAGHALVRIKTSAGEQRFLVEVADTAAKQRAGLMHRIRLAPDGGMLFAPYPPDGGGPARAAFWMNETPLPLDIVYVRGDRTIDSIAAGLPNDQTPIASDMPVAAVLEVAGGRASELGIHVGDRVDWELGR